jgi:CheY-like chemotaxis protein
VDRAPALFPGTRVLLAEDNATNSLLAQTLLEKLGCTVIAATNGLEALAEAKNDSCELILMDCQMPELDGYEATRLIRAWESTRPDRPHLPIVALTANALTGDREKCLAAGMDDYLTKPINKNALLETIRRRIPVESKTVQHDA